MRRVAFIDTSVLIAAARGNAQVHERAMRELDDPDCVFTSTEFVKLEVLPKAVFGGHTSEVEFYEEFFAVVVRWATPSPELVGEALEEGKVSGLSALDALHVVAAVETGAEELVTVEKPEQPLHRTKRIKVRSIHP